MSLMQRWSVLLCILLIYQTFMISAAAAWPVGGGGGAGRQVANKHGDSPKPIPDRLTYTRHKLLQLSRHAYSLPTSFAVPEEVKRCVKKRGKRGGIRVRCRRRGGRVPVPMVVCGNVRSLRNKIDELHGLIRWDWSFRESSLICLTETWLQEDKDPDSAFMLDGFTLMRGDRTVISGKSRGGGVCAYINSTWCSDVSMCDKCCNENIEYIVLSLRPFYLPREFNKVYLIVVYIPPSSDAKEAENILSEAVRKIENSDPDAVKIITGDFNHCNFGKSIPHFQQFVSFPTRDDKLLDPFFCNVRNSYVAKKLEPLGISDHNMCLFTPVYRQLLKRNKPSEKLIYSWNKDVNDTLLGCLEATDFDVLYDSKASLDKNVDVLNSYLHFCIDNVVPTKIIRCFPNNKPWVTKELKELINKKKYCYGVNDKTGAKSAKKEIDTVIKACKDRFKQKIENMFKRDTKSAWNGIKQLTGMKKSTSNQVVNNSKDFCNDLNVFYSRFDKYDFSRESSDIINQLQNANNSKIVISNANVLKSLQSIKIGKASGPDKINGNILKMCKEPLAPILCRIFQQSLNEACIPKIWKTSEITPIPKKLPPMCKNDYRPIALTSVIMKCLEKIVKDILLEQVNHLVDNYQFAYTKNRCVEDAILSFTDYVLNFLDKGNTSNFKRFVRVLFVDFSSAFNTIQPHLMMSKLRSMNVNFNLILWINNFLTQRPQYVSFQGAKSSIIITNVGAPQGCVLSPVLFTIYTSDCVSQADNCQLFKYADDTVLVGRCGNDDTAYREEVRKFVDWCTSNFLELNVKKTKEMVVDYSTSSYVHPPLIVNGEVVERVQTYKYLGTIIDNKFSFNNNVEALYKKINSRMYFVRQLSKIKINRKIMDIFYSAIIQSVLSFNITCWYGNCNLELKNKLCKIMKNCGKLGVQNIIPLLHIYKVATVRRCEIIQHDQMHPLNHNYQMLPSGRRMRSLYCRTSRYSKSFVPSSIKLLNDQHRIY